MSNELSTLLNPQIWRVMCDQAGVLVKSKFLPSSVQTSEQAIAIMMKGYEVGFPPMLSFTHISIIKGKPCISAEGQLSLIYKNCPSAKINFIKLENDGCAIEASRSNSKPTIFKFELEDAKLAGLLGKDVWKQYPRAMFRSRCVSEMARSMFPDAIMGFSYTPEEIADEVKMDDNGNIVEVKPIPKPDKPIPDAPPVESKSPENQPLEKPKKVFDKSNKDARKWVENEIAKKGLFSNEDRDAIIDELDGKVYLDHFDLLITLFQMRQDYRENYKNLDEI